MFFVDGQRSLHDNLLLLFRWQGTLQLILDWHHLDKKCQEQLSRAMNNRHARVSTTCKRRPGAAREARPLSSASPRAPRCSVRATHQRPRRYALVRAQRTISKARSNGLGLGLRCAGLGLDQKENKTFLVPNDARTNCCPLAMRTSQRAALWRPSPSPSPSAT